MQVGPFAEELFDGPGTFPHPDAQRGQVSDHDPAPLEYPLRSKSGIDALGLLALRHHQVADQDADERDPVVLVAHAAGRRLVPLEVDLARDFFAHLRVHDQVREEEAGEEGHVGIKDVVPGRGRGRRRERSQRVQDDRPG